MRSLFLNANKGLIRVLRRVFVVLLALMMAVYGMPVALSAVLGRAPSDQEVFFVSVFIGSVMALAWIGMEWRRKAEERRQSIDLKDSALW
ncbi:MAG: hypothetical protein Q7V09_16605 [Hydrogenophaga sp.]|uniref:hypothetical protein n=1 Tax=Hydrogenophaga sp. TaxID=1904254 RepID=UPI0027231190|nr:hypothetical protein [Hydrogenophaga sp.]MDO9032048.1 hypothetical protein [Hydrogenophaga sp.]